MSAADAKAICIATLKLFHGHDMPTVSTALAETIAAWLLRLNPDDDSEDVVIAAQLASAAMAMAEAMRERIAAGETLLEVGDAASAAEAERRLAEQRVEQLPTRPTRGQTVSKKGASPWGYG